MVDQGQRSRLPETLSGADPGGLLYGALLTASMLVATGAHSDDYLFIAGATALVLVIFWLAHVYVQAQALQISGDRRHIPHRVRDAALHEMSILQGWIPAIVVYLGSLLVGFDKPTAAWIAAWFSAAMLTTIGFITARRAGLRGWSATLDAAIAGMFGVVVILGKALLH